MENKTKSSITLQTQEQYMIHEEYDIKYEPQTNIQREMFMNKGTNLDTFKNINGLREGFKKKFKKLAFDQKGGGGRRKNQLANFIFYFSTNNEYGIYVAGFLENSQNKPY